MNKKHLSIVAAAAIAVGSASYVVAQDTANPSNTGQSTAGKVTDSVHNEAAKVGIGSADQASQHQSAHAEAIHDVLAQVAEAAFTKDGLDDMAERFVDADRNRLGQNQDALKNDDTLNGRIDQLAKDWKAKYNNDFDIKDEDKVYTTSFAMIGEGEIGDRARTASETLRGDATKTDSGAAASGTVGGVSGDAKVNTDTGTAKVNVDNNTGVDAPKANTDGQTAADTNRNDPGRNIATVHITASHGMPALDVPMIHEAGGWKLDIPDSVDGAKFKSNVTTALTEIGEKKDQWSADQDDAYRHVTHRLLLAIFDKPAMDAGTGAAPADTGAAPPDTGANPAPASPATPATPAPGASQ